jgi:hypothetical protein
MRIGVSKEMVARTRTHTIVPPQDLSQLPVRGRLRKPGAFGVNLSVNPHPAGWGFPKIPTQLSTHRKIPTQKSPTNSANKQKIPQEKSKKIPKSPPNSATKGKSPPRNPHHLGRTFYTKASIPKSLCPSVSDAPPPPQPSGRDRLAPSAQAICGSFFVVPFLSRTPSDTHTNAELQINFGRHELACAPGRCTRCDANPRSLDGCRARPVRGKITVGKWFQLSVR